MSHDHEATRQVEISEESQRRLRTAAIHLFAERGYRETSVRDIADAAGISRGSITWHFGSKAGLLEAIVKETIGALVASLEELDDATTLESWLELYRYIVVDSGEVRLFPMLLLEAIGPRSEIRDAYVDFHQRMRDFITRRIAIAQQRGNIDDSIDAADLAAMMWATLVGAHLQWRLDPTMDLNVVIRTLIRLFRSKYAPPDVAPPLPQTAP
jgi:TetR/AcrR family acrAB operon transcriptional repressor